MGLFRLLTFPVTAPVSGLKWVSEQVLAEAERQYYDETAIRQEMLELEGCRERQLISESEFELRSEQLFERLLEANARRSQALS